MSPLSVVMYCPKALDFRCDDAPKFASGIFMPTVY